ncbi:2,3,4,5-tetrahydropyridine-2,6-dicarboxylate N-succinyltransferase [Candidatus Enterovibrio escicola]|uniref:2,3,4,5-tetrahydropyridine-2,6-dicarboxylate N-succinyltransferase n=1 Tax=Candidatus Enterovibrio escicola TaxID=1927127 RepID=A0A2A5T667_9GAMM|nr:2,3,4,5-tetrahydropyridine-2,6-dicarboxylate N-succinyltransferase [Candidatus Enterovibrio escacola]PCS23642.1 2,3,4,5-tetrahydropyridine-2,6-dicarboxylate N-succinyltransferase [Candidatus Enterovibrio escacola]
MESYALAFGIATKNKAGKIIEAFFPTPVLHPSDELYFSLANIVAYKEGNNVCEVQTTQCEEISSVFFSANEKESAAFTIKAATSNQPLILIFLSADEKPTSIAESFLKLQLISHRIVKPHSIILDGMFSLMHNIAWTSQGAIDLPELAERQMKARLNGKTLTVHCVDKFPRMLDYVVPSGIRVADASRIRLGAYVGEGTTVMHEGFINFNAGTVGVSMVEGRISAGVMVGKGSDIGGGASIMGTLSGGGQLIISIGENSLLGANSGLGFPLGDRCTIESGLYVTAGTKVTILDPSGNEVAIVKARDLAGKSDLLFRRNSVSGKIECKDNKSAIKLNPDLHANN